MVEQLLQRQLACILRVAAVGDISQSLHALPCIALDPDRSHHLAVNSGFLFALAQISKCRIPVRFGDLKECSLAGSAAIKSQYEAWSLRGAAMNVRIDTQRAVFADQTGGKLGDILKSRLPHQRPIAKYPEVAMGKFRVW